MTDLFMANEVHVPYVTRRKLAYRNTARVALILQIQILL